jgi:hypothetical protein
LAEPDQHFSFDRSFTTAFQSMSTHALRLALMVKNRRAQHDGSLRAFVLASPAADAAIRIHSSGVFDCNSPDRTDGLAYAAAKTPLCIGNGNVQRDSWPLLDLTDTPA